MIDPQYITTIIPDNFAGSRLDQALSEMFADYSRSTLKNWVLDGKIQVDTQTVKPRMRVYGGEKVELWIDPEPSERWKPQAIDINILYEDEDIIVINKQANLVVHPGAGNPDNTLVNALLHHDAELDKLPRAGIVHRLDKDTTGIMVVARSLRAHTQIVQQLQTRSLKREYQAVVNRVMTSGGSIDAPIGRHKTQRTKMAVIDTGKPAVTHYRITQRFRAHTHLQLQLESGRTHQIRVHLAHLRYPIVGDPVYGGRFYSPAGSNTHLLDTLRQFKRQALHSTQLTLAHPANNEVMSWNAPVPEDMQQLLDILGEDLELNE